MNNAYYFRRLSAIGGVETFFYHLARMNKDKDLTFYFNYADPDQLNRLKQYAPCLQYRIGTKIKCKRFFCNFNLDPILNGDVEADEIVLVVHGNYRQVPKERIPQHPAINRVIAVSQDSAKYYTEMTGIPCEVVYNPLILDPPNKVITLMSATRFDDSNTNVKGTWRVKRFIEALDKFCQKTGNDYIYFIFSDSHPFEHPKVQWIKPRLDISGFEKTVNFGVQLSDNVEGFCYTTNEFLCYGTPMLLTPCEVYKELGITEDMAVFVDFDMSNIDECIEQLYSVKKKFSYKPPKSEWNKLLVPGKRKVIKIKMVKVKATDSSKKRHIKIAELGRIAEPGEIFEVAEDRLPALMGDNPLRETYVCKLS